MNRMQREKGIGYMRDARRILRRDPKSLHEALAVLVRAGHIQAEAIPQIYASRYEGLNQAGRVAAALGEFRQAMTKLRPAQRTILGARPVRKPATQVVRYKPRAR